MGAHDDEQVQSTDSPGAQQQKTGGALHNDNGKSQWSEKTTPIVSASQIDSRDSLTQEEESIRDQHSSASPSDDNDEILESDYTPEQYAKLLKKIDRYLLPLMWFCYGIQQTDKTAMSTQALFGLREDTHLVGQQYSWLTTIFYLTYLSGEFPSNFLLQRWALGRTLSIYMLCWGICVVCIAAAQNWTHLMVLRGLQGFFECTISSGFILVISSWYRTEEHASRQLFWQSANAGFGVIFSLAMYGIGTHAQRYGGFAAWRAISLFLGTATLLLSVTSFLLLGSPKEVRWMNKDEKRMAAARIVKNKAGRDVTGVKWAWPQVTEAFKDPQLYFCCVNAFLSSVPNGGLSTFGTLMNKSFGFTTLQVLLMNIPRSVVSVLVFLAVGIYTRRVVNRRMYIMALATLPALAGMLALALLPNTPKYKWTKWGMYLMTMPCVLSLFLSWSLISSNVAGRTKKTLISSATFIGYCTGNMCGSQIFKAADGPRYIPGTIGCVACFGLQFFLIVAWRLWYVWQNRRRDREAVTSGCTPEEMEKEGRDLGERDVTDLRNPHFRYTL